MLDDLLLAPAEGVVSEDATQDLQRLTRFRTRFRIRFRTCFGTCFGARLGRGAGFRGAHPPILRGTADIDQADRDLRRGDGCCRTCSDLHRL
ncbi:hypothetical protein Y717_23950 [Streptomyces scopuliridis RB72]|uniref:Uncharacterized protein n=1 Tax=Streptomyces scopuliridis RB72 TaxID=1440053 RepID=A0A2T7SW90_9ACTN|nr:hypothetical protein Y717_23950 [Streptomyces scopuliridis RB72]